MIRALALPVCYLMKQAIRQASRGVAIPDASGQLELGMLHRPLFPGTRPEETARHREAREVDRDRESIWISYCPAALKGRKPHRLGQFTFLQCRSHLRGRGLR
jgi:hypothetical protein